jgi:hypothetical protein
MKIGSNTAIMQPCFEEFVADVGPVRRANSEQLGSHIGPVHISVVMEAARAKDKQQFEDEYLGT